MASRAIVREALVALVDRFEWLASRPYEDERHRECLVAAGLADYLAHFLAHSDREVHPLLMQARDECLVRLGALLPYQIATAAES